MLPPGVDGGLGVVVMLWADNGGGGERERSDAVEWRDTKGLVFFLR